MPRNRFAATGTEGPFGVQQRDAEGQAVNDRIQERSRDKPKQTDGDPGEHRERSGSRADQFLNDSSIQCV
jgi:hypothetical protein